MAKCKHTQHATQEDLPDGERIGLTIEGDWEFCPPKRPALSRADKKGGK